MALQVVSCVLLTATLFGSQQKAGREASPSAPVQAPQLSQRVIAALQELGLKGMPVAFYGLSDFGNGSQRLYITSNRASIAYKTSQAASQNGKYTPTGVTRLDVVYINCGDSDIGDIFNCARVRVARPDKRAVRPLSYSSGPNTYKNAMGARWTVREVTAIYLVRELRDGFSVDYASLDGTEWTFEVTADTAREKLLLLVGSEPPESE